MIPQKAAKNSGVEIKIIIFLMITTFVGLAGINLARAGGGHPAVTENKPLPQVTKKGGPCPQPRKTQSAPAHLAKIPIPASANVKAGAEIFQKTAKPIVCKMCHGVKGKGNGPLGKAMTPRPRNFTCAETMKKVSPGQMFWIIKNGSKGTGMRPHDKKLSDQQIWDVVKYINTRFVKR